MKNLKLLLRSATRTLVLALALTSLSEVSAQTKLGDNPTTVDASALLEMESTSKGFLISRMTNTQRDAISSPASGLMIYSTTDNCLQFNKGTSGSPIWACMTSTSTGSGVPSGTGNAGDVYIDSSTGEVYVSNGVGYVKIPVTSTGSGTPTGGGSAGDIYVDESTGDVYTHDGTTWINQSNPNLPVYADSTARDAAITSPEKGQQVYDSTCQCVQVYDGSKWVDATGGTTTGTGTPTGGGTGGDIYIDQSTGDVYTHDGTTWINQSNPNLPVYADSTARDAAITSPEKGQQVYDSTCQCVQVYDGSKWVDATGGTTTGTGTPTGGGTGGDIYVDQSTGDVYTYDGTTWINQSDPNLPVYADSTARDAAITSPEKGQQVYDSTCQCVQVYDGNKWVDATGGTTTGTGTPTGGGTGGDIYVDQSTGDVYTYDGTTWINQSDPNLPVYADATARDAAITSPEKGQEVYDSTCQCVQVYDGSKWVDATGGVTSGSGSPSGSGSAGDLYVDETSGNVYTYDGTTWINQSTPNLPVYADATARDAAITSPEKGQEVYDSTCQCVQVYDGSKWVDATGGVTSGSGSPSGSGSAGDLYVDETTGDVYTYDGTSWVNQSTPNLPVYADATARDAAITSPEKGQEVYDSTCQCVQVYDGSKWVDATGGLSSGAGAPSGSASEGDMYVDETTGQVYTYSGGSWNSQAPTVYRKGNNVVSDASGTSIGGSYNIALGDSAGNYNTRSYLVALGYQAADSNSAFHTTAIGYQAAQNNTAQDLNAIGVYAGQYNKNVYVNAIGRGSARWNGANYLNAIGYMAGDSSIWSGGYSNLLGYHTGQKNKGGYLNAIGYQAGQNNQGSHSNAIGYQAAQNNTAGSVNAIGLYTGRNNTGVALSAIGTQAGENNTGSNALLFGPSAGRYNSGSGTNALGANSARNNSGNNVVAIGTSAAMFNAGSNVTAIGYTAAAYDSASTVVAIGTEAAMYNKGGGVNAVGHRAASYNSGGNVNAIGASAMQYNTATYVNAMGQGAGQYNQGGYLAAMGYQVASYNVGHHVNTMGYGAASKDSGDYVNAFGYEAAGFNKGDHSNGLGYRALKSNKASHSTALGYLAGEHNQGVSLFAVGHQTGRSNTGNNVICIGSAAGGANLGHNLTALGQRAGSANKGLHVSAIGASAAGGNVGDYVNAIGISAAGSDSGDYVNVMGYNAARYNKGDYVCAMGNFAGTSNSGSNVVLIGNYAGAVNNKDYVNIIGRFGTSGYGPFVPQAEATILTGDLFLRDPTGSGGNTTGNSIYFNSSATARLWYDAGEIKATDNASNTTTISPHNFSLIGKPSEDMAWAFYSYNPKLKKQVNVDMMKQARLMEKITGEKLVYLADMDGKSIENESESEVSLFERMENLEKENDMLKAELEAIKKMINQK